MSRFAVVDESDTVVNVIVWEQGSRWEPPEGHQAVRSNDAAIGDVFVDGEFQRPAGDDDPIS